MNTPAAFNDRSRALAVLRYQRADRLPVVHFGYWTETLAKWATEGHLKQEWVHGWGDGNDVDKEISRRLGFDTNWYSCFHMNTLLRPWFQSEVLATFPDGSKHVRNGDGVVVLQAPDSISIPSEIEHLLKDRASWQEHYLHRFAWHPDRVDLAKVRRSASDWIPFAQGGSNFLRADTRDFLLGIRCGSLLGNIRNIIGVENLCYLGMDDPDLLEEIIAVQADLCYRCVERALATGAVFDFGHFWEDICYKNGPLVTPSFFDRVVGPHYKRLTDLMAKHGIDIVSLDCDGLIDALIPTWIQNGVNTMFPIEVGTWNASIAPWRQQYGKALRGVGGMNKVVFSHDRAAVDAEIERLKPLVALGGYIPCPDHRIPPDANWDSVRYYCDRMHQVFG